MPSEQIIPRTILDDSFFADDCTLANRMMNAVRVQRESIADLIPASVNNTQTVNYATLVSFDTTPTGQGTQYQDAVCDPSPQAPDANNHCKIAFTHGRWEETSQDFDITTMVTRACLPEKARYDFFIPGPTTGSQVSATQIPDFGSWDFNDLYKSAVMRQAWTMRKYADLWMEHVIWRGDDTGNAAKSPGGAYREFNGIERLNTNTYDTDATLPVVSQSGDIADCSLLNNITIDAADGCICDGTTDYYAILQDATWGLVDRADMARVGNVQWGIFMTPNAWQSLHRCLPCQMVVNSCPIGQVNANDGGSGMFNLAERNRMATQRTIELNGMMWPVYVTRGITETADAPTTGSYRSDIHILPFSVDGMPTMEIEYKSFAFNGNPEFNPIARPDPRGGWSDGGRFWNLTEWNKTCFQLITSFEARLLFLAPQLSARITNVVACPTRPTEEPTISYAEPIDPA